MRIQKILLSLGMAGLLTAAAANGAYNTSYAAAASPAAQDEARSFTHEAGGITFDLPAGWKAEQDGEQLTVSPAGGGVAVVFWMTEQDNFDAVMKALGEELGKQLKNLKFDGEPKEEPHNGMHHVAVSGSGEVEGHEVLFSADVLQAKKPLIVLTFGSAENLQKHSAEYSKLVKSIRKAG